VPSSIQESTTFSTFIPAAFTWNIESTSASMASRGDDLERADVHRLVQLQPLHVGKAELAHHVEQFVEDAIDVDRRRAVEQVQALERAVVVVEMRDEDGVEAQLADLCVVEAHVGKGVAVAAERVLEDRIEGDAPAFALEHVAGVQDARDRQCGRGHAQSRRIRRWPWMPHLQSTPSTCPHKAQPVPIFSTVMGVSSSFASFSAQTLAAPRPLKSSLPSWMTVASNTGAANMVMMFSGVRIRAAILPFVSRADRSSPSLQR
jgi:hypothetical protein